MRFERHRSSCSVCPLRDRNRVPGEGTCSSGVAVFGEAPGKDEDYEGRPFVGAAGKFLNKGFYLSQLVRSLCWVSNTILCRPPDNEYNSFEGQEAQKMCRRGFFDELLFLRDQGIKVILALGNNAARYFGITGGIMTVRGSVYNLCLVEDSSGRRFLYEVGAAPASSKELWSFVVIPTFHPQYFNYMGYNRKDARVDFVVTWVADLKKAKGIGLHGWNPPQERFITAPSLEDIEAFLHSAASAKESLAFDIESTGLNPDYSDVVCIGFARNSSDAICVPFLKHGGRPYWKPTEEQEALRLVNRAFAEFPLIVQNALFDVDFLRGKGGFKIDYDKIKEDIMLLHHSVSSELPHKLGFIVSGYGSTPYWKGEFLKRSGTIFELADEVVWRYNLRDCVVLHQVLQPLLEDAVEEQVLEVYRKEALQLLKPVGRMQENGVLIDEKQLVRFTKNTEKRIGEIGTALRDLGSLPDGFNLDSGDDLRYFLFGIKPAKFDRISQLEDFEGIEEVKHLCENPECKRKTFWTKVGIVGLCPKCEKVGALTKERHIRSKRQKERKGKPTQVYQDLLVLKEIREKTKCLYVPSGFRGRSTKKRGDVAVDDKGRLSLQMAIQNRLELISKFSRPTPFHLEEIRNGEIVLQWLKLYNNWSKLHKLLTTYSSFPVGLDGRAHTHFLIHGTSTGRLSSSKPNLLNIPRKEMGIRKAFVAPPGSVMAAPDYKALEARVLAYETNDQELIDFLEGDNDIHSRNAILLFGIDERNPKWKIARFAAKIFYFGRICYGGSDYEIYTELLTECPDLRLTLAKVQRLAEIYEEHHPVYREYRLRLEEQIRTTRTVCTFMGRKRTLMGTMNDIRKQGLNLPIQGGAAHIINQAMIRIQERLESEAFKTKLLLQIHDELVFEIPINEKDRAKSMIIEEMERPVKAWNREVRFPIEWKEGPSWGEVE